MSKPYKSRVSSNSMISLNTFALLFNQRCSRRRRRRSLGDWTVGKLILLSLSSFDITRTRGGTCVKCKGPQLCQVQKKTTSWCHTEYQKGRKKVQDGRVLEGKAVYKAKDGYKHSWCYCQKRHWSTGQTLSWKHWWYHVPWRFLFIEASDVQTRPSSQKRRSRQASVKRAKLEEDRGRSSFRASVFVADSKGCSPSRKVVVSHPQADDEHDKTAGEMCLDHEPSVPASETFAPAQARLTGQWCSEPKRHLGGMKRGLG